MAPITDDLLAEREPALLHELQAQRFSRRVEGELCVLDYRLDGNRVTFTHTGVPPALRGRGLAADLVAAGLDWARTEGLEIEATCSYVLDHLARHPDGPV